MNIELELKLRELLIAWRKAEKEHAAAVLRATHPDYLRDLYDAQERAIHALRIFVDSEPWGIE